MDKLRELLLTFTEEEVEEFTIFLNRYKKRDQRKDVALTEFLLEEEYSGEELQLKLYKNLDKKDAYHTLRKRLFKQLTHYVMLRAMDEDHSSAGPLMGLISLAKHLIQHNCFDLGWKYLNKAQKTAEASDQFTLLHQIYLLQLEYLETNPSLKIDALFEKIEANKILKEEEERFQLAYSRVKASLIEHKKKINFNIDQDLDAILEKFEVKGMIDSRPKFLYKLIQMVRSGKMTVKDFKGFQPFVQSHYDTLKKQGFKEKDWEFQAGILYLLSHAMFRNKRFEEATNVNIELEQLLDKTNRLVQSNYHPKLNLMQAAIYAYTDNLNGSIDLIDNLLATKKFKLKDEVVITAMVNKAVYLFFQKDKKAASKTHNLIPFTDKEIEKIMGKEWALKKALMEIVLQFEMENYELVISKVRNFQRNFSKELKLAMYSRISDFAYVIRDLALNTNLLGDKDIWLKIDTQFDKQNFEVEDLHAMTFYAWLRSKVNKLDFHQTLLKHIAAQGDQEKYLIK